MYISPAYVLARVYKSASEHAATGGLAILIWPLAPSQNHPGPVESWEYIGQHASADLRWLMKKTRIASRDETNAALRQWRSEGPDRGEDVYPISVRSKSPKWATVMASHEITLKARTRAARQYLLKVHDRLTV